MHPLVSRYLYQKEQTERKGKEKKKAALLLELGLYEKEYSPENRYSREYPESEYDAATKISRYYRKRPVPVTDEEYAEILSYQKDGFGPSANGVASIFKVFAWIIFAAGFIAGLFVGNGLFDDFSFARAFLVWGTAFVAGMIFYGVGEIVQLLADIKNK